MTSLGTPESHGDKNIGKGIEPVTGKTNKPNIANTVTGHKFLHPSDPHTPDYIVYCRSKT